MRGFFDAARATLISLKAFREKRLGFSKVERRETGLVVAQAGY